MSSSSKLIFCVFSLTFLSLFNFVSTTFDIQIFGDYVSKEDYNRRTFCSTKICILDSDRLLKGITQNKTIRPCDDFKTFAMGEFLRTRVINERYPLLGFEIEVTNKYAEKMRNILKKPIKDTEPKMSKVVKSYYQKCVDSDTIMKTGAKEMLTYLNEAGSSPLTGTWNESSFNFSKQFYNPLLRLTALFFDHELSRCNDPRNSSNEVLCLRYKNDFTFSDNLKTDIQQMFKSLSLNESSKSDGLESYLAFLRSKKILEEKFAKSEKRIVRIKDLNQMFPDLTFDWTKLINENLLPGSHVTDEDEVGIESPDLIAKLSELFLNLNKSTIANSIAISFLYENRQFFITYAFDKQDSKNFNVKKSVQRYERCILNLNFRAAPAVQALAAQTYFNKTIQTSAAEMVQQVFTDIVKKIETTIQIDDVNIKNRLIDHLRNTKSSIMFPNELLNETIVEEFYQDLEINISESLLLIYLNLTLHHKRIMNDKSSHWKKRLNIIGEVYDVRLLEEYNLLVIPREHTFYPTFHPERPRFFNMATFYMHIAGTIYSTIESFLMRKTGKVNNLMEAHPFVLMDENYLAWEAKGGKDLELSSFRMTNRQMMWLALANRLTVKIHKGFPIKNENLKLVLNLHKLFMSFKEFRNAFHCNKK